MSKGVTYLFTEHTGFRNFINDPNNALVVDLIDEFPLWRLISMKAKYGEEVEAWNLMINNGCVYLYVDNIQNPDVVVILHGNIETSHSNIYPAAMKNGKVHLLNDSKNRSETLQNEDFKNSFKIMATSIIKSNFDHYINFIKPFYNSKYEEDLELEILKIDSSEEVVKKIKVVSLLARNR